MNNIKKILWIASLATPAVICCPILRSNFKISNNSTSVSIENIEALAQSSDGPRIWPPENWSNPSYPKCPQGTLIIEKEVVIRGNYNDLKQWKQNGFTIHKDSQGYYITKKSIKDIPVQETHCILGWKECVDISCIDAAKKILESGSY